MYLKMEGEGLRKTEDCLPGDVPATFGAASNKHSNSGASIQAYKVYSFQRPLM